MAAAQSRAAASLGIGLAFLIAAASAAGSEPLGSSGKLRRADGIADELREAGRARIIVEFTAPAFDETDARGDAARQAVVRATQDSLLAAALEGVPAERWADRSLKRMQIEPLVALEASAVEIARLARDPRVVAIHHDAILRPSLDVSVPLIGMPRVQAMGGDGRGQAVAIIDSGVDADHPFLAPRVVAEACFTSRFRAATEFGVLTFSPTCPGGKREAVGPGFARPCSHSECVHGTHVAGIAAGNNPVAGGVPAAGVAPEAAIIAVQVFAQNTGYGILTADSDTVRALEWVYAQRNRLDGYAIAAVNMSLGGYPYSADRCDGDVRKPIIDKLRRAGIATVIASGNDRDRYRVSAPSCISTAVTVGASNDADRLAPFSNMSAFVDLLAPGVGILSSVPGGYAAFNGTSMAAPHVAGAFAALRSEAPNASVEAITAKLAQTGVQVVDLRKHGYYAKPRIAVGSAWRALAGGAADGPSIAARRIEPAPPGPE